jgi:hypothetical protein
LLGAAAPDAFKKFLLDGAALHTFEFAGHQLLFARHYYTGSTADFDAVAYSRGYGAHIAEDAVGHHHDGYLTRGYDHAIETAVDTWYVSTFPNHGYTPQYFSGFSPAVANFVTQAMAYYARETSAAKLSNLPATAVQSAMRSFDALTSKERVVIDVNALYKLEMVKLDNYGATDFSQALAHLQLAQQCALQAARYWQTQMEQSHPDPAQAGAATRTFINTLFAARQCQP